MARKVHELRILREERSAAEVGAPLLVISQFTLYGDTRKGRRPSWVAAAAGTRRVSRWSMRSWPSCDRAALRCETGVFGASMQVASVNDGPFTVLLEI